MPCVDLVVTPHPLTLEGRTATAGADLYPGESVVAFLQRHGVDVAAGGWQIAIGGALLQPEMWHRTRPRPGQVVEARRVAERSVLRLAAMVALAYFAPNFLVFYAGTVVINQLLGPKVPSMPLYDTATGTTYSLQGGRNRARLYEPLGLLFGVVRVAPDYAAQPFSWFDSDDQYQYLRLHAGINCGAVADLAVGDTALAAYADVTILESGFPGSSAQLMDWSSVDTVAGGTLEAVTAPGAWTVRTSSVATVTLAIDLVSQLYALNDEGNAEPASVALEAERRLLPGGSWVPFVGETSTITLNSHSTKPVRVTVTAAVAAGQHEVRLRKATVNTSTTRAQNVLEWAALKSYQRDSTDHADQPQVGIRIKATGQLNGTLDEVTWLATSKACDVWTGSAWVTETTSNPGAHFLRFARGIYATDGRLLAGMGKSDAQIDIEALQGFMVHCASHGYRFDHWFDQAVSCGDVLDAIAAAGLGSKSYHSGKLGVVWSASGQPKEAVISPVRMKPGTFRVDYATRETADELEATWLDRDNHWLPASVRVKAPGVTVPRETARLAPVGATTQAAGLLAARVAMAQNIWQRKAVSWEMDLEHIAFRRLSIIALSHDITQWGYSGRLHSAVNVAGTVTVTLDREVPFNSGAAARYVALHIPGELGYRVFGVVAFTGTTHTLTLSGAWPSGVPLPGDSVGNPAHDTVWLYDFKAEPGQRLRVVNIEPTGNLGGARITAVPEPDAFWDFVAGGAYEAPTGLAIAAPVVVSNVQVTQARKDINYDETAELSLTWDATGPYDHAQVWGAPVGDALVLLGEARTTRWPSWRVSNGGSYFFEIRPFDALGRPGEVVAGAHTVALSAVLERAVAVEYSVNGATSWHATFTTGDTYMRQRVGSGAWSAAIRIVGEQGPTGGTGATGHFIDHVFKRAASLPSTPTGNGTPTGWYDAPPAADGNPLWMATAEKTAADALVGSWAAPVRLDGEKGTFAGVVPALPVIRFQKFAIYPGAASAGFVFRSDGSGEYLSESIIRPFQWYLGGAPDRTYYVELFVLEGPAPNYGTAGSAVAMTSDVSWTWLQSGVGISSVRGYYLITDAAGSGAAVVGGGEFAGLVGVSSNV